MNLISEDYLMHHGVKGMKWGVRHDPERVGRVRNVGTSLSNKRKGLTNKQKRILKGAAIAAGLIAAAGIGTIAVRNIKMTNAAKKEVIEAIERNGHKEVRDALNAWQQSAMNNRESAKFLHDPDLKRSAEAVASYHERHYAKIKPMKDQIVADRVKSVPKKEIKKEAKSLTKHWKSVSKDNSKIYRYNEKIRKRKNKGKASYSDQYKKYKERNQYDPPFAWRKYYSTDWY